MIVIREQDPLKQGLKHIYNMEFVDAFGIREQDPLKQGLKLDSLTLGIEGFRRFVSKIH